MTQVVKAMASSIIIIASEAGENCLNSFITFAGRGPGFIIVAHFCISVFWARPSQEVEKYSEKGCLCGISGLTGSRKYSNLRENMLTYFSGYVFVPLTELGFGGLMFTERFATGLKLLTHISFSKLAGLPPTQFLSYFGTRMVACSPHEVMRKVFLGGNGKEGTLLSPTEMHSLLVPPWVVSICLGTEWIMKSLTTIKYFGTVFSSCQEEPEEVPL